MSLGVIPELDTPTYGELRNRKEANWYVSDEIKEALNSKLKETNKEYSKLRKIRVNIKGKVLILGVGIIKKINIIRKNKKDRTKKHEWK